MERPNIIFPIEPAGHTRLVGDDKHEEAGVIEQFNGRLGTVDPAKTLIRADIAVIVVEHAVPVEKDGRASTLERDLVLGAAIRVGNADIDKISLSRHRQQPSLESKYRKDVLLERAAPIESVDQGTPKSIDAGAD